MDVHLNTIDHWLEKPLFKKITRAHLILLLVTLLSLGLHLLNAGAIGDGNTYYTAAVKSMLQSWHNFFFVSAEPGGSVTVDKPPLGFWIETLFAWLFGLSGFTVSLPNIIAGVLSVPLIYHLTRKYFGTVSGLAAALVYVFVPVVLAADRNNTIDGMLVLTLLLAAWAFIRAAESGRFGRLLLASVLVGLAFKIKMLQAYLPLPAFFLLYFFASKLKWNKRLLNLGLSALIILAISFSWALAVDLTPAAQRPYVGSSDNNTETELIIGYNGLARLFGRGRDSNASFGQGSGPGRGQPPANGMGNPPAGGEGYAPDNSADNTQGIAPMGGQGQAPMGQPGNPGSMPDDGSFEGQRHGQNGGQDNGQYYGQNNGINGHMGMPGGGGMGGGIGGGEIGNPGPLRFFQSAIGNEIRWMLPFALLGLVLLIASQRLNLKDLSDQHKGALLWGGWLLTCLVFFSVAKQFHAYYMIMLALPIAVLCGAAFGWVCARLERLALWQKLAFTAACALTIAFQVYLAMQYIPFAAWLLIPAGVCLASGILLLEPAFLTKWKQAIAVLLLLSMLAIPAWWSVQTVLISGSGQSLPAAYAGETRDFGNFRSQENEAKSGLLDYLQANTQGVKYLVAVNSSQTGAPYVLATGRPVLYMGGFAGGDDVIDAQGLAALVEKGELRYVLEGGVMGGGIGGSANGSRSDIATWLEQSCTLVDASQYGGASGGASGGGFRQGGAGALYRCGD